MSKILFFSFLSLVLMTQVSWAKEASYEVKSEFCADHGYDESSKKFDQCLELYDDAAAQKCIGYDMAIDSKEFKECRVKFGLKKEETDAMRAVGNRPRHTNCQHFGNSFDCDEY